MLRLTSKQQINKPLLATQGGKLLTCTQDKSKSNLVLRFWQLLYLWLQLTPIAYECPQIIQSDLVNQRGGQKNLPPSPTYQRCTGEWHFLTLRLHPTVAQPPPEGERTGQREKVIILYLGLLHRVSNYCRHNQSESFECTGKLRLISWLMIVVYYLLQSWWHSANRFTIKMLYWFDSHSKTLTNGECWTLSIVTIWQIHVTVALEYILTIKGARRFESLSYDIVAACIRNFTQTETEINMAEEAPADHREEDPGGSGWVQTA